MNALGIFLFATVVPKRGNCLE